MSWAFLITVMVSPSPEVSWSFASARPPIIEISRESEEPPSPAKVKTCLCSPLCTCGCNAGLPCRCQSIQAESGIPYRGLDTAVWPASAPTMWRPVEGESVLQSRWPFPAATFLRQVVQPVFSPARAAAGNC